MVDESQDTDQLQIELIASLIEPGQSFIIAIGDRTHPSARQERSRSIGEGLQIYTRFLE